MFEPHVSPKWTLERLERVKQDATKLYEDWKCTPDEMTGIVGTQIRSLANETRELVDEVNRLLLKREQMGEFLDVARQHAFHEVDRVRKQHPGFMPPGDPLALSERFSTLLKSIRDDLDTYRVSVHHSTVVKGLEDKLKEEMRSKEAALKDVARFKERNLTLNDLLTDKDERIGGLIEESEQRRKKINRLVHKLKTNAKSGKVIEAVRTLVRVAREIDNE